VTHLPRHPGGVSAGHQRERGERVARLVGLAVPKPHAAQAAAPDGVLTLDVGPRSASCRIPENLHAGELRVRPLRLERAPRARVELDVADQVGFRVGLRFTSHDRAAICAFIRTMSDTVTTRF